MGSHSAAPVSFYSGRSPLFLACMRNDVELARSQLREEDGDLNQRDDNGDTPLLKAVMNGCTGCVQLLVEAGADLSVVDAEGTSGFLHACQFDELDTIQYLWPLQQKYPQTLRNAEGQTPLMIAAIFGNLETMKFFCDEKCDLEEVDECGKTALIHASMHGNLECIRMLLSRGALVEHADAEGDTPLIWAAWQGHPTCVEFLLAEAKAKIDHQDESGCTALMNAVRWGHSECIRVLLDHGADVTLQSTSGGTAWSLAVCAEHPETEVIQWLQDAAAQATPIEPPS